MGIGERLREERERLALNQEEFGAAGGVRKQAQLLYEKGERHPDSSYLAGIAELGADVLYIITDQRSLGAIAPDEATLLNNYRNSPPEVQAALKAASSAGRAAPREVKNRKKAA